MKKLINLCIVGSFIVICGTCCLLSMNNTVEQAKVVPVIKITTPTPTPCEELPTAVPVTVYPTVSPTIAPTRTPKPTKEPTAYYDVPLSHKVQDYIFKLCKEHELSPSFIIAIIEQESDYNSSLVSSTNDYGLMQINICNHAELRDKYGVSDFLNPYENILCGVKMYAGLYKKYGSYHCALMAYNMGEGGARRCWRKGIYSSRYSRSVMARKERIDEQQGKGK